MIKRMLNLKTLLKLAVIIGLVGANILASLYVFKAYKFYSKPSEIIADANHEVTIHGAITDLRPQMREINKLVKEGVKEIFIDIYSPGGRLDTTETFLRVMKAAQYSGVTLTCVVTGYAASAATIILSQCDNRYALFGTGILWHSMIAGGVGRLNQFSTTSLLDYILIKNEEIWAGTRKYFYPSYFAKHFLEETMLLSTEVEDNGFGFISVINNYKYKDGQVKKKVAEKKKTVTKIRLICKPVAE